ncbi:MAG: hypothetical protein QOG49_1037, partial [Frankiaceae bacterium]|nr:hypothetical protein [Frankiaceae bacterium]
MTAPRSRGRLAAVLLAAVLATPLAPAAAPAQSPFAGVRATITDIGPSLTLDPANTLRLQATIA